jgi:hypothetical protein
MTLHLMGQRYRLIGMSCEPYKSGMVKDVWWFIWRPNLPVVCSMLQARRFTAFVLR